VTPGHSNGYRLESRLGSWVLPGNRLWYLRYSLETGSGGDCVRPLLSGTVGLVVIRRYKTSHEKVPPWLCYTTD